MKIKIIDKSFDEAKREFEEKHEKHQRPKRPGIFWRTLMKLISIPEMMAVHFKSKKIGMEKLGKNENALYLMNHSSFIDLEIVATLLYPRPFNIITTTDGFVGKDWLMRQIGCIPTKKFVPEVSLIRDVIYASRELKDNIIMFPEAGYSFDGTSTVLPDTVGKFVKMLKLPLVMIRTYGAFARDPLYNNLHKRRVDVSATMKYLLSPEEIEKMSEDEINKIIREQFSFDNFRWQKEKHISISEPSRAEGLERILYKCPHCMAEGKTRGEGEVMRCSACDKEYKLGEFGELECDGEACEIPHIPDWYKWEREMVKGEIERGEYSLDIPVDIVVSFDTKNMYHVGEGRLTHGVNGFHLKSCDGEIDYEHKPLASYTVCSDFNWYEIGDVISFGDNKCLYYCFPKVEGVSVAKVRLATEEIYKIEYEKHNK